MTEVTLLHVDGCPSWRATDRHLRRLVAEPDFTLTREQVGTAAAAERLQLRGSPTVGLSCRIHQTPEGPVGSPTLQQLRRALT